MAAAIGSAIANTVGNAVGGIANSGQYGAENTATVPLAPDATGAAETGAINALPAQTEQANVGIQQAAEKEKGIVAPVAAQATQSGQAVQKTGVQLQQEALQEYQNTVAATHQKALDTEAALQQAQQNAAIDPQRYLNNMGVGQKTLTAIGIALSGMGSGITGQPNLAMQAVQTNINRDIAAQQQIFQNKMEKVASERGLLQSAQDRQTIAQLAFNQATIMVGSGVDVALKGAAANATATTAPDVVQQLKLKNDLNTAQGLSNYNTKYVQTIKSGNTKNTNLIGVGADVTAEQLTGQGIGYNKNPLATAKGQAPNNAIFYPNPAAPSAPLAPANQSAPIAQPVPAKSKPTSRENFLDQLTKSF